jgi:hypothetical protein
MMRRKSEKRMNYDPIPSGNQPKPFDQLLEATFQVYGRSFGPMVAAAALGIIPSNLISFLWQPEGFLPSVAQLLVPLVPLFIAQAALTVMAWQATQRKAVDISTAYAVALSVAPRYVLLQLVVSVVVGAAIFTVIGIPIALLLLARWAITGPSLIVEQLSVGQALQRSWRLVEGRALRTLGAVVVFLLGFFLVSLIAIGIAAIFGGSAGATIVVVSIMQSMLAPLAAIFFLLLYEDYRRITETPAPPEQSEPPDPPSFIR